MKDQDDAVYPEVIERLIGTLKRKLQRGATALDYPAFRSHSDPIALVSKSQALIDVSEDLRALVNAYAQSIQAPRPNLTEIANAQRVSPSALRRRYRPDVVEALTDLMDGTPDADSLLIAFPSLAPGDLFGLLPTLDVQLLRAGESPTRVPADTAASTLPFLVDVKEGVKENLPVTDDEAAAARAQLRTEHAIIGKIAECFRTELSSADWVDAWVSSPGKVRLEWAGGIQISQFLGQVLPNYDDYSKSSPTSLVSGIHALRVRSWDEASATLDWYGSDEKQSIRVIRLPQQR